MKSRKTHASAKKFRAYICDTPRLVNRALDEGKSASSSGAQGTWWTSITAPIPIVTSPAPFRGDHHRRRVPPTKHQARPWVSKAYTTRVGLRSMSHERTKSKPAKFASAAKEFGAVHWPGRAAADGSIRRAPLANNDQRPSMRWSSPSSKSSINQREIQVLRGHKSKARPSTKCTALARSVRSGKPEYKTCPAGGQSTYGLKDNAKLPKAAVDTCASRRFPYKWNRQISTARNATHQSSRRNRNSPG